MKSHSRHSFGLYKLIQFANTQVINALYKRIEKRILRGQYDERRRRDVLLSFQKAFPTQSFWQPEFQPQTVTAR